MSVPRTLTVVLLAVGLVVPVGAGVAVQATADAPAADAGRPAAAGVQPDNGSEVNVTVGQQLSTVVEATEDDVGTDVDDEAFEAEFESGNESERAEAVAERAEELRERARDVREDYREATRAYERGELTRSEYARRIAVLNARAENVLESHRQLTRRAGNVSGLELRAAGLNRTELRRAVADVENVTGAGPAALLARFTGQRTGEVELETASGLSIEVESEDGERAREVRRARDDDDAVTVEQSRALSAARSVLSAQDGRWVLREASVHPDSGYYEFEFALRGNASGEAEVRVDGSTGEPFRIEEEIGGDRDERDDDERDDDERDDDEREHDDLAMVVADGTPAPGATVTVQVLAGGDPVADATVTLNGAAVGRTGANGTLAVTLPERGEAELEARTGEADADLEFEFEPSREDVSRAIEPTASYDDGAVTLTLQYDGSPVENVVVAADGERVGTTGAGGTVTFRTDATEELELELRKGEFEAELAYRIVDGSLVLEEGPDGGDDAGTDRDDDRVEDLALSVVEGDPAPGATVTVAVTAGGEPVADATVRVGGRRVGTTDADGTLAVTLPDAEEVTVTAAAGDEDADREFEFESGEDSEDDEAAVDALDLSVVEGDPAPGATVTVEVTAGGQPVAGAAVSVEGDVVGTTGADGTVRVTLPEDDEARIEAETENADGRLELEFED